MLGPVSGYAPLCRYRPIFGRYPTNVVIFYETKRNGKKITVEDEL